MHRIFFGLICCLLTFSVSAQQSVFKNLTWEQASELARKEGKIVLVDAMMKPRDLQDQKKQDAALNALFGRPEISEFCNKNVVAIRIDMSTEAGRAFAPKMTMFMYPAYAFFMPNGDILGVASPFKVTREPQELLSVGEKALQAAQVKRQNSRSIIFEDLSYKEAIIKAKKENKLVFIDAYTSWCQPCVLMAKNVFTLDRVADFYNRNFINLKIDFGKEKELAKQFEISGYPAFLFINGDGKLLYKAGGYTEEEPFIAYGQEALKRAEGIEFVKETTWQQALDRAKKENKLIFMDCYTSWCGPCKMLAKTVFTDPEVGTLFNENFVNVKMDMEQGEGKQLKDRYQVKAYPTLLFINGDGEVVHCVVGGVDAVTLISQAKIAGEGKGLAYMQEEYRKGNRQPGFIQQYLNILDLAGMGAEAEAVCLAYFKDLDKNKLKEKEYWELFVKYVNDANSEVFTYVYDNRADLCRLLGEKDVKKKISNVCAVSANRFVSGNGEQAVFDKKGFKRYTKWLSKADVEGKENIIVNAKMGNAERLGDWKTYIALGSEQLKKGKVADLVLYNWGLRINRLCKDEALRLQVATWFEDAAAACAQKEAEGKVGMMSYRTYFEKMAEDLKQVD